MSSISHKDIKQQNSFFGNMEPQQGFSCCMPTPSGWATSKMTIVTLNFGNKVNIHSVNTLKLGLDDFIHIFYWYLNINKIILIQNAS